MPSVSDLYDLYDALVSPRFGIIRAVAKLDLEPDDVPLHYFGAAPAHTERYWTLVDMGNLGGAGWTHEAGLGSLLGEAVERYSLWSAHRLPRVRAAYRDLDAAIPPSAFPLFTEEQYRQPEFRYPRPDDEDVLTWIEGRDLATGESVWVPAGITCVAKFRPINSTGTATGWSVQEATLSALLELVERDSFTIAWYARLALAPVDLDSVGLRDRFEELFQPTGVTYRALHLPSDIGIPIVLAVATADWSETGAVHVGAAASTNVRNATCKALLEAAQCRPFAKRLGPLRDGEIVGFDDHVRYWNRRDRIAQLNFLFEPADTPRFREWADMQDIVATLSSKGIQTVSLDITPRDMRDLGVSVIRVVSPQLVDIDGPHAYRFLANRRIYEMPLELGLRDRPGELNPLPHPFP